MSDTESRKSMDDVLASIRKIVRAEKDPENVQTAETVAPDVAEQATSYMPPTEDSAPLSLTPDMMMDAEPVTDAVSEDVETVEETAGAVMSVDADAIREMVREVVMEQLSGSDADALIRSVIRQELTTGDIGANISKNVLRLIRTEVGNALNK